MTTTTCPINCDIESSQSMTLDSSHTRLQKPRANEFEFELDVESNESVSFEITDFTNGGTSYTVAVSSSEGSTTQAWSRNGSACVSPTWNDDAEISITVQATPPSGAPVTGGGIIRIQPKGKPD